MIRRTAPRGAFTLIELLVVIAIIAVLVGLTSAAVMRVRIVAKRTAAMADISQIANAIGAYKAKTGAAFIPAAFVTFDNYQTPAAQGNANAVASSIYLKSVFPSMDLTSTGLGTFYGDGTTLDGNQALLLFLTGGPAMNFQGFSTDRLHPFKTPVAGEQRIGPFYDIKGNKVSSTTASSAHWLDEYGNPYAYFAHNPGAGVNTYTTPVGGTYSLNGTTVAPYKAANGTFLEPKGFQIISAGQNGGFGPGGTNWTPGGGAYAEGQAGGDDLANFNRGPLVAQQ